MLGSSTYGAQAAAALGLPFCYAYHFAMSSDVDTALRLYRTGFRPSDRLAEPHVMVSASVIAAETTEEAQYLAGPSRIMALSLRTGRLGPIVSPEAAAAVELSDLDRSVLDQLPGHPVRRHRRRGGRRPGRAGRADRRGRADPGRHRLRPGVAAGHAGPDREGLALNRVRRPGLPVRLGG